MFEEIIKQVAIQINNLGYISRVGGIATAVPTENGKLPASILAPFDGGELEHLTPDDSESGVCWFEAAASMVSAHGQGWSRVTNEVTMILWLNYRRLDAAQMIDAEMSAIRAVKNAQIESQYLSGCNIDYTGDLNQGAATLARWAFQEDQNGLALPPYRVVAHRFTFTYILLTGSGENCATQVATVSPAC